jgi:Cysteine rich repeat
MLWFAVCRIQHTIGSSSRQGHLSLKRQTEHTHSWPRAVRECGSAACFAAAGTKSSTLPCVQEVHRFERLLNLDYSMTPQIPIACEADIFTRHICDDVCDGSPMEHHHPAVPGAEP